MTDANGPRYPWWRRKALVCSAIVFAAAVAIVASAIVATAARPTSPPRTGTDQPVAEGAGRSLLYAQEVNSIFGVKDIAMVGGYGKLAHDDSTVDPAECKAVANPESEQVWQAVDWEALSGLYLQSPEGNNSHFVLEAIFGLSSPEEAQKVMTKSAQAWRLCLGKPFSVTEKGKEPVRESMNDFQSSGDIMTALVTVEGTRYRCQLVRMRLSKYVVDAQACGFDITDQAEKIADLVVGRLKEKSGS